MIDDLEERLRRTYRAVAEHTVSGVIEPHGEFTRAAVRPSPGRRWAGLGFAAAVVLLLVGGLAVLTGTRPDGSTSAAGAHVLPTWLPSPSEGSTDQSGGGPRLVSITSTARTDVIEYASDALNFTIRVDRTPVDDLDGPSVEVRGAQMATTDGDDVDGRLRWRASSDSTVTIAWSGRVVGGLDGIADVVDGLVLVDLATWESAIEFGGFTRPREMLRRTVGPVEVFLSGDLQQGMSHAVQLGGTFEGFVPSPCLIEGPGESGDGEYAWAVVSRFPSGSATITWSDGVVRTTELSAFVDGSSLGVGVVERPREQNVVRPDVVCEAGS